MLHKKTLSKLSDYFHIPLSLFLILLISFLLRIPSLLEPYYYGDEMIYLTLGQGVRRGITLYKDLHDNKPPLLYLVAAISGNLFWFKTILAVWCLATTTLFWKFVNKLFPKRNIFVILSTSIFALATTLPIYEGNIANAELFMIGPTLLAFYVFLFCARTLKNSFLIGLLFSFAALFKIPAAFDILAIFSYYLIIVIKDKKTLKESFFQLITIAFGFILPIIITLLYYYFAGAFKEYLISAYLQNFGYLSTWKSGPQLTFWQKNSAILIRFSIAVLGNVLLFIFRNKLSKKFLILSSWILWGTFAVTLSERPYPHYFIQILAPVSVLIALFFTDKTNLQTLTLLPLFIAFSAPFYYKFWSYPLFPYYKNFINLTLNKIPTNQYLNYFDPKTTEYYEIAKIVNLTTLPDEKVFVWGDSATIYALSRRLPPIKYTVEYHINDFSDRKTVIDSIKATKPIEIVILEKSSEFPELVRYAKENYILLSSVGKTTIWKRLNNITLLNNI